MKVFTLDSSYLPSATIENFDSVVWTERYEEAGEFEIIVEDDISILTILPLNALLSHTDTKEVMIVENHEIKREKDRKLKVTVSGRSFETFAEHRTTAGSDLPINDTSGNAYSEILTAMPSCHAAAHILKYKLEPGTASAADAVSNLSIVESVSNHDAAIDQQVKRGNVYSQVLDFLRMSNTGIRSIRPHGNQTTLNLVIHDGVDRTNTVIFYAQYEDLDDATYFRSTKRYKNYARVSTKSTTRLYRHRDLLSDLTGLDRKIIYKESSDIEGLFDPPSSTDAVSAIGQAVLDEYKNISLIQAKVSDTAKPRFKYDYEIGDLVTVFGEFGASETMRITEHILTVDKNGIRGYPALSSV